jgi:hypothetical protein
MFKMACRLPRYLVTKLLLEPPNVVVEWLAFLLPVKGFPVQISARRPVTQTEAFRGFSLGLYCVNAVT